MDRQLFTERARKLEARLYRIGYGLLREEQDRMDAVQEALLKAWRHCGHLKDDAYFDTWLTRIFINECTNIQRRQGRQRALDERINVPAPTAHADNAALRDAILSLKPPERLVVILQYMEGYTLSEIASLLGEREGTIKSRARRAKMQLKAFLTDDDRE